jgi:predicted metal-dependent phosphoesterase TrpH
MKILVWTHSGKNGKIIARFGDGVFVPKERLVEIEASYDDEAWEILEKIKEKYDNLGIPLEYDLDANIIGGSLPETENAKG